MIIAESRLVRNYVQVQANMGVYTIEKGLITRALLRISSVVSAILLRLAKFQRANSDLPNC